jgi:hypothetical protein
MPDLQQPLSAEARELRREYLRQVYTLRGYIPGVDYVPQVEHLDIKLSPTEIKAGGRDATTLGELFVEPPFAALLNGKYPLDVRVVWEGDGRARVSLSAPDTTPPMTGTVSLVWSRRRAQLRQRLSVLAKATGYTPGGTIRFDPPPSSALVPGMWVAFGHFPEIVTEVLIGGDSLGAEEWRWTGQTLMVKVPSYGTDAPMYVLTSNGPAYETRLRIATPKTTAVPPSASAT